MLPGNQNHRVSFRFEGSEEALFEGVVISGIGTQIAPVSVGQGAHRHQVAMEDPGSQSFSIEYDLDAERGKQTELLMSWYRMLRSAHALGLYQSSQNKEYYQMRRTASIEISLSTNKLRYELSGVFPISWKVKSLSEGKRARMLWEFSFEEGDKIL
ncbi:MAG: hypothetical protein EA369_07455 [Bradymonadales bacterium]|nr:MAG: hypothetical protein EA369_07455 [Bradymonadales bacterium]